MWGGECLHVLKTSDALQEEQRSRNIGWERRSQPSLRALTSPCLRRPRSRTRTPPRWTCPSPLLVAGGSWEGRGEAWGWAVQRPTAPPRRPKAKCSRFTDSLISQEKNSNHILLFYNYYVHICMACANDNRHLKNVCTHQGRSGSDRAKGTR